MPRNSKQEVSDDEQTTGKRKDRGGKGDNKAEKKRKLQPRCTSPSHFLVPEEEEVKYGPEYRRHLPERASMDSYFRAVATMYYQPRETHTEATDSKSKPSTVWVSDQYDHAEYPTLDTLLSPLRRPNPLDDWTPKEIAIFESGICAVGKQFNQIAKLIRTKTTQQVVSFYYCWKKSNHYMMWRDYNRPTKDYNPAKEDQWKAVREKMSGFSRRSDEGTQET